MSSHQSIWYRLGFALERARLASTTAAAEGTAGAGAEGAAGQPRRLASLKERSRRPTPGRRPVADDLFAAAGAALAAKALDAWRPRRGVGPVRLLKAGLAGAGTALVVDLVRPVLRGRTDEIPVPGGLSVERLLAGAAQGVLYAGVVEPRVPGPPLLKGTLYGSAEYVADPAGGLTRLLGARGRLRRIPLLSTLTHLLEDIQPHDRIYLEHVTFGIVVALLYGSSPRNRGMASPDSASE